MNNLEQIPLDFTKTQKKWITRVCVALSLIYEMISLMSDFNTDYSDGFFILLPILILVCVNIKTAIFCFIPRFLFKTYFCILQIFGLIMNKNLHAEENEIINITPHLKAVIIEYSALVIPIILALILTGIFKNRIQRKTFSNTKIKAVSMTVFFFLAGFITIFLMQAVMKIGINNFCLDIFEPYKIQFSSPLMISLVSALALYTIISALFYFFQNKLLKNNTDKRDN